MRSVLAPPSNKGACKSVRVDALVYQAWTNPYLPPATCAEEFRQEEEEALSAERRFERDLLTASQVILGRMAGGGEITCWGEGEEGGREEEREEEGRGVEEKEGMGEAGRGPGVVELGEVEERAGKGGSVVGEADVVASDLPREQIEGGLEEGVASRGDVLPAQREIGFNGADEPEETARESSTPLQPSETIGASEASSFGECVRTVRIRQVDHPGAFASDRKTEGEEDFSAMAEGVDTPTEEKVSSSSESVSLTLEPPSSAVHVAKQSADTNSHVAEVGQAAGCEVPVTPRALSGTQNLKASGGEDATEQSQTREDEAVRLINESPVHRVPPSPCPRAPPLLFGQDVAPETPCAGSEKVTDSSTVERAEETTCTTPTTLMGNQERLRLGVSAGCNMTGQEGENNEQDVKEAKPTSFLRTCREMEEVKCEDSDGDVEVVLGLSPEHSRVSVQLAGGGVETVEEDANSRPGTSTLGEGGTTERQEVLVSAGVTFSQEVHISKVDPFLDLREDEEKDSDVSVPHCMLGNDGACVRTPQSRDEVCDSKKLDHSDGSNTSSCDSRKELPSSHSPSVGVFQSSSSPSCCSSVSSAARQQSQYPSGPCIDVTAISLPRLATPMPFKVFDASAFRPRRRSASGAGSGRRSHLHHPQGERRGRGRGGGTPVSTPAERVPSVHRGGGRGLPTISPDEGGGHPQTSGDSRRSAGVCTAGSGVSRGKGGGGGSGTRGSRRGGGGGSSLAMMPTESLSFTTTASSTTSTASSTNMEEERDSPMESAFKVLDEETAAFADGCREWSGDFNSLDQEKVLDCLYLHRKVHSLQEEHAGNPSFSRQFVSSPTELTRGVQGQQEDCGGDERISLWAEEEFLTQEKRMWDETGFRDCLSGAGLGVGEGPEEKAREKLLGLTHPHTFQAPCPSDLIEQHVYTPARKVKKSDCSFYVLLWRSG